MTTHAIHIKFKLESFVKDASLPQKVGKELCKQGLWESGVNNPPYGGRTALFYGSYTNAVTCVLMVQKLHEKFPWFKESVETLRMYRIEEISDLMPAIDYD